MQVLSKSRIEAAISYSDNISDNFAFNISTNISTIDNEVLFVESAGFQQGGDWGVGIGVIPSRMELDTHWIFPWF